MIQLKSHEVINAPGRNSSVDIFRSFAILSVVIYHYNRHLPYGYLGVDLFFVISGLLIGNILIPIAGSVIAIYDSHYVAYVGLYGVCFFLIDIIFIERIITERRTKAAKIQELFDCDVLQMKKSPLKALEKKSEF